MILQALDGCYHRLASRDDPPVPPYGYSDQAVSYALVLGEDGPVRNVVSIGSQGQRRFEPARIPVPGPVIRTSGVASNFLWDKSAYLLGVKRDQDDKAIVVETLREHAAFRKLHEELLAETNDEGLRAVLAFLAGWTPSQFGTVLQGKDALDTNFVFRLDGELRFIHDRPAAREIWGRYLASKSGADGLCLVTGDAAPLARLHPAIKGVRDAQPSGASIVSFNLDAFTSFGKDQGLNAPVSEHAAFAYSTALNHLLRPGEHNRQRLQIGDATTVFWAEACSQEEEAAAEAAEDLFGLLAAPPSEDRLETQEAAKVRSMLEKIAAGRPLKDIDPDLDPQTRFFILGLAPNAARLSVRFWHADELGSLAARFREHWQDLAIEPRPWKAAPATWQLLYEAAAQRKAENIPPNLAGEMMRAILTGARYPGSLFTSIVMRCRADRDLNGMRAAILKACLVRADRIAGRKESVSVSLDLEETNAGYRLGRLFAVLESAQGSALGDMKATIRERYYGAASATPGSVFPLLVSHYKDHLKAVRTKKGEGFARWYEKRVGEIVDGLVQTRFPRTFKLEDQGRFAIGYYHERESIYRGKVKDAPAELKNADLQEREGED